MIDGTQVVLALITAVPIILGQYLSWKSNQVALERAERSRLTIAVQNGNAVAEVHDVVNSKHAEALAEIMELKGEVVRLQTPGAQTPSSGAKVILAIDGTETVTVP